MRGKAAKALRKVVRAKYPQLEEADKRQFKGYLRKVKKVFKNLTKTEKHKMLSATNSVSGVKVVSAQKN